MVRNIVIMQWEKKEFDLLDHTPEFMKIFMELIKSQMPITKAKYFYCRSKFIDYYDDKKVKTFTSYVPWSWDLTINSNCDILSPSFNPRF